MLIPARSIGGLHVLQSSRATLDDAVAQLAAWMELASDHLTEDDMTVLISVGGALYREGLRRRMPPS